MDLTKTQRLGVYRPPFTVAMRVETEGGICGSVTDDVESTSEVHANKQDVQDFDDDPFNFSGSNWD